MARPRVQGPFTANFTTPTGWASFDLIFSSDFTGTVDGVAYDGSVDAVQSFDAGSSRNFTDGMAVVVTTGNVRVAGVI